RQRVGVRRCFAALDAAWTWNSCGSWRASFRFLECIGTLNRLVLVLVLEDKPLNGGRGGQRGRNGGSWKASTTFVPCIGTMNLKRMRRHRQGAAGILPAVLCSDGSADKMPAALWSSWQERLDSGSW